MTRARTLLVIAALTLGLSGAALAGRAASAPRLPLAERPVEALEPLAVAGLLAAGSPDVVVVTLDTAPPKHALRGAVPMTVFGADEAAFVERAPRARRVVLASADPVRMDRVARRLVATGHRAVVLKGGVEAWDRAMDADPPAPAANAPASQWKAYRSSVALRRSFGDAEAAAPVAAPVAPVAAPSGGAKKKREGC